MRRAAAASRLKRAPPAWAIGRLAHRDESPGRRQRRRDRGQSAGDSRGRFRPLEEDRLRGGGIAAGRESGAPPAMRTVRGGLLKVAASRRGPSSTPRGVDAMTKAGGIATGAPGSEPPSGGGWPILPGTCLMAGSLQLAAEPRFIPRIPKPAMRHVRPSTRLPGTRYVSHGRVPLEPALALHPLSSLHAD
jgi:hypothetical protein